MRTAAPTSRRTSSPARAARTRSASPWPCAPTWRHSRRGPGVRGDSLLALAMKAYDDRRYDAASAGLTGALAAGTDSAPAEFFLGAALLMLDRPEAAAETFGRVIALGDTPYLGEARFYRAKALLRQGNGAAALSELHAVASSSSAVSGWARALADSVESRMRR